MEIAQWLTLAFDKWLLMTSTGIFLLIRALSAVRPLNENGIYRRLLPVLPEVFGVTAALTGGIPIVNDQPLPLKIATGIWCAYLAKNARKVLGQTIIGDDANIKRKSLEAVAQEGLQEGKK